MSAISLANAVTWNKLERSVLEVFSMALDRLVLETEIPQSEHYLNHKLFWRAREALLSIQKTRPESILFFGIIVEANSQPVPDDEARASRLGKRPDFLCLLANPQASTVEDAQVTYYIECKRLGKPEGNWKLNQNYSDNGINRFVHKSWEYAKGCQSGAMIGYVESMTPDDILTEVNQSATGNGFPSLRLAANNWAVGQTSRLRQAALHRGCLPNQFVLQHLWVDMRNSNFVKPPKSRAVRTKRASKKKIDVEPSE